MTTIDTGTERAAGAAGVLLASTPRDADAAAVIEDHHAELAGHLQSLVGKVVSARDDREAQSSQQDLAEFCTAELLPHARAEERTLYPLARGVERASLLVESMIAEHRVLEGLARRVAESPRHTETVAAASALLVLFDGHLISENELLLPVIAGDPDLSLADALVAMQSAYGAEQAAAGVHATSAPAEQESAHGHSCGCGEADSDEIVLDVREVPHKIRHATVFGAYDAIPAGGTLILVAPHDPLPLLRQIGQRDPGVQVTYDERGPEAWRLRLTRGS